MNDHTPIGTLMNGEITVHAHDFSWSIALTDTVTGEPVAGSYWLDDLSEDRADVVSDCGTRWALQF